MDVSTIVRLAKPVRPADGPSFPDVPKIQYGGPKSKNPLEFKYYNPDEVIDGKSLKEHFRFSVVYWHTFCNALSDPFGVGTAQRPWDDGTNTVANAHRRAKAAFELFEKLGVPFYAFHDRDIAPGRQEPQGKPLKSGRDRQGPQGRTGTHRRQAALGNGQPLHQSALHARGGHQPELRVSRSPLPRSKRQWKSPTSWAAGYTFWGGREGYSTLLNTDMKRELDHLARFLHMAVDYKKQIGFQGTFYIEPKPKEPTKHQYDSDAAACLNFLRTTICFPISSSTWKPTTRRSPGTR